MKLFRTAMALAAAALLLAALSGCAAFWEEFEQEYYQSYYQEETAAGSTESGQQADDGAGTADSSDAAGTGDTADMDSADDGGTASESPSADTDDEEALYSLGDRGPAGGRIFYDKGSYEDGWRYLEAAPQIWSGRGIDPKAQWGAKQYQVTPSAAASEIGTGMVNTECIVAFHDSLGKQFPDKGDYYEHPEEYGVASDGTVAAKLCYDAVIFGYDDWFLPSAEELSLMHEVLHKNGKGGFSVDLYWSSTEKDMYSGIMRNFYVGAASGSYKDTSYFVRPVRAF